jgi:hypothetical protein
VSSACPARPRPRFHRVLTAAVAVLPAAAIAQDGSRPVTQAGTKSIRALRIDSEIKLDGALAEEPWRHAEAVSDFVQQEPEVGQPATERTEVRALIDRDALYFGVACFDSDAGGIVARELRRDNPLANDDRFEIVLDTFHDHRNAYHFVVNPRGTQYDAQSTDEGQDVNVEWDERWYAETALTGQGWTAEVKIPLAALRSRSGIDTFGVNFKRFIRRKNEGVHWTGWDRDYRLLDVSQAGHLLGLAGIDAGLKLRVKPFVLGGFRRAGGAGSGDDDALRDLGLEVVKFSLTPGLTAEVTLNTDFAQTEVDDAVINLTRFPTFFPEKREFFLERAGIFEFGPGGRRGAPANERNLQMFFSRRIGLTGDRREVPMLGGAKVVGQAAGLDVGLLSAQTGRLEGGPQGANYTVLRLKRNILSRSNVGTFFSNRQTARGDYNRVGGTDVNLTVFKNTYLVAFAGKSFTPGLTGNAWVGRAKANWFTDTYELFAEHLYVGPDFQHDVGYVRRRDIRRSEATAVWQPRPHWWKSVRNFVTRAQAVYTTDVKNRLATREQILQGSLRFQSDDALRFNTTDTLDRVERRFEISRGVFVPAREYHYRENFAEAEASGKRVVGGRVRYGFGDFYSGTRRYWVVSPALRPSPHASLEASYEWNEVSLPEGAFETHLVNGRLNLNLSNRWLSATLVQYDSASERTVLYFRLNHIYRPGDDVFFVYNQASQPGSRTERALMVKITYSFDLR